MLASSKFFRAFVDKESTATKSVERPVRDSSK